METVWNVLKWVLVALVTGFVGYVGRFGAQWLIERARARRRAAGELSPQRPPPSGSSPAPRPGPTDEQKAEKKRAKAQAKAAKKGAKGQR
ncbi:MAG: hypothetical protein Kow0097_06620 [Candidatus Bipolaricaulota bacterium]|nr:hypothetical protein [Candidatus Bipolaricaulota bacterium]